MSARNPLPSRKLEQQRLDMSIAIGECMQAWAHVEVTLIVLFRDVSDMAVGQSDAYLTKEQGFKNRLKVINKAARSKLANSSDLADWELLRQHAHTLSELRNEVAHATMMVRGDRYLLQPYFLSSEEPPLLAINDVNNAAEHFHDLAGTLRWFHNVAVPSRVHSPPNLHAGKPPDLIVQLRSKPFKVTIFDADLLARIPGPYIARAFQTLPPAQSVADDVVMDCFVDVPHLGRVRITARRTTRSSGRKTLYVWTAESAVCE